MEKMEANKKASNDAWCKEYQENIEKGIFHCQHVEEEVGLRKCKCSFMLQNALDACKNRGKHNYPPLKLADEAACTAAKGGDILALGSRRNKRVE